MKTVDSRKINTAKIRDLRLERGITQAFIARRMGYKYTSGYSNIEKGTGRLSHKNAVILSEILMCELNFFYE
ncbi:helix-turn-helix transcriptional regulator [Listeria sp. FSL L7-0229]|uniref:helix-turn-helix domain-containing protein n=1 Tax=Listeria cossartiae TaxID=2838249 RepID=UPI00162916D4|nr:helix-turn-helix transcriptional regulator [Listeria cossartiae]MBC2191666.1 helix-turn-helix transcriptional regulator [Listeria cossartiae subsp. cossartiae]